MLSNDFDTLLTDQQERMRAVLGAKATEYGIGDRLHNFKVAAAMTGVDPAEAAWNMAMKHFVSVQDIVKGCTAGKLPSADILEEKITDSLNYLVLIKACIKDKAASTLPAPQSSTVSEASNG